MIFLRDPSGGVRLHWSPRPPPSLQRRLRRAALRRSLERVDLTKKGDCVASYRYPMRIANGFLANGGAIALTVSGKVAPSGAVIVKVSNGTTSAVGSGRLAANAGGGSWRGASCSGSWTAERRSS